MPPKRKISNAKVLREHGAETQLQPLIQNYFRSILRQRSAEPELESYRSRSYSNLTMNQNHQLNPTEFSRPRLISPPPQTKKQTKLRTKSAKKIRYDTSSSESDNDDDNETDKSSYDSSDSTSKLSINAKHKLIEPSSKRPFILQSNIYYRSGCPFLYRRYDRLSPPQLRFKQTRPSTNRPFLHQRYSPRRTTRI
jgi:hypothetical protein